MIKKLLVSVFVQCFVFCFFLTSANASQQWRFGRNERLPEQDISQAIFVQMMSNLKMTVVVEPLPPARANMYNNNLHLDGELARIDTYAKKNPDLIRVEPSHYSLSSVVYMRKTHFKKISSITDLLDLKVGHIRGVQHSADLVKYLSKVEEVNDSKNLFTMLNAGRFDAVITTSIDGDITLAKLKLDDQLVPVLSLDKRGLYVYLNKKSAHLRNAISKELDRMKKSGEMDLIIRDEIERLSKH